MTSWWKKDNVQSGIDWIQLLCHAFALLLLALGYPNFSNMFEGIAQGGVTFETDKPRMKAAETFLFLGWLGSRLAVELAPLGAVFIVMNLVLNGGQLSRGAIKLASIALEGTGSSVKWVGSNVERLNKLLDVLEAPQSKVDEEGPIFTLENARNLVRPMNLRRSAEDAPPGPQVVKKERAVS